MPKKNLQSGQTVIVLVLFLLFMSMILVAGGAGLAQADLALSRTLFNSKQVAAMAESGLEDVTYRIRKAMPVGDTEVLVNNGITATTTIVTDLSSGTKTIDTLADLRDEFRHKTASLFKGDEAEFNYGVQAGNGGFVMENSSKVLGNVYSNGVVTGSGNLIQGSVISAGATGKMEGIHATSSAYAHTIKDSTVDRDAYYQVKINTTVSGLSYPGSADKPTTSFPISDETLDEWEADAEAGGTISSPCPYTISGTVTIGPKKINCDTIIANGADVTVAGMIWVVGKLTIKNSSSIVLDSALGARSIAVIADKSSDRATGSTIELQNSTTFTDSGTKGSFFFLVSRNNSAKSGGGVTAIDLKNSVTGPVFLYTNQGKIAIGNNSRLRATTGYLISMKNSAELVYEEGLETVLFDTGPGGSWDVTSWKETQ